MLFHADATIADLARLAHQIDNAAARGLARTAQYAAMMARTTRAFTDHTHYLRGSIHHGVRSRFVHFVRAGDRNAPYAGPVEHGSRAHIIRAKLGRGARGPIALGQSRGGSGRGLLTFQIGGRWISKPFVKHPGTKPTHFMRDARDAAEAVAHRMFEAELNAVIGR